MGRPDDVEEYSFFLPRERLYRRAQTNFETSILAEHEVGVAKTDRDRKPPIHQKRRRSRVLQGDAQPI